MFESVRTRPQRDTSRWLAVAFAAACLHAATVAAVVRWQAGHRGPATSGELPEVTFFSPLKQPGPAPGPSPQPERAPDRPKPTPKARRPELVAPAVVPDVVPQPAPVTEPVVEEPEVAPPDGPTGGGEAGSGGSDGSGTGPPGSTGTGEGTGTGGSGEGSGDAVLPFGEGMTKPECDRAAAPIEYTREALEAQVEGLLIIRCTVRAEGSVESCQLVKGLPHMSEIALQQVSKWKCRPATFQGRPVSIDYFFNIRLTMPQ